MSELAPIVVGIDGGDASVAALELAAHEADLRHVPVLAVTCWPSTDRRDGTGRLLCSTHDQASELLEHVIGLVQARRSHPSLIIREVVKDGAGPALVSASRHAELLVLGSTTTGPFGRHRGRATLEFCLSYAECPVAVVRTLPAAHEEHNVETFESSYVL